MLYYKYFKNIITGERDFLGECKLDPKKYRYSLSFLELGMFLKNHFMQKTNII